MMKSLRVIPVLLTLLFVASFARAEETRLTDPSVVSVEILGRALSYSVNFDEVLDRNMAAGAGIGQAAIRDVSGLPSRTALMIPVYFNYYFMRDQGSFFATGGATIVGNSADVNGRHSTSGNIEFTSSVAIPNFGAGYENRSERGFLFRAAAYGIAAASLKPWLGFSFGYAF